MIVFLHCTTNNGGESVFSYFWEATREFGTLSRVRFDKGGENILFCYFMVPQEDQDVVAIMLAPPPITSAYSASGVMFTAVLHLHTMRFSLHGSTATETLKVKWTCLCYILYFFHRLIMPWSCSHVLGTCTHFTQKECGH